MEYEKIELSLVVINETERAYPLSNFIIEWLQAVKKEKDFCPRYEMQQLHISGNSKVSDWALSIPNNATILRNCLDNDFRVESLYIKSSHSAVTEQEQ